MYTPRDRPFGVLVGGADIQNCHRSALIQPVSQRIHADRHAAHRRTIRLAATVNFPRSIGPTNRVFTPAVSNPALTTNWVASLHENAAESSLYGPSPMATGNPRARQSRMPSSRRTA